MSIDLATLFLAANDSRIQVEWVHWAIGIFLVWSYAQGRFSSEKAARSSTTYVRYVLASWSYVFAMLGFYALLTKIIGAPQFHTLLNELPVKFDGDQESLRRTAPLVSALLLTTALPQLPFLNRLDEAMQSFCQKLGNVPWEAHSLCNRLMTSGYFVPEHLRTGVMESSRNLADEAGCLQDQQPAMREWLQVTALIREIGTWNESDNVRYLRFYALFKAEFLDLEERWNWIRKGIRNHGCLGEYLQEIHKLRQQVCHFVARGVLFGEMTGNDRALRLEAMGFKDVRSKVRKSLTVHELTAVALLVFALMTAGSLLMGSSDSTQTVGRTLKITVMVSLIYVCAVWAAIFPKSVSPVWRIDESGDRPWLFYLIAGVFAMGLQFVISFLFNLLSLNFDLIAALESNLWSAHYYLMSFTVSVALAALADNCANRPAPQPGWLRWAEGAAVAGLLAMSSVIVQEWRGRDFLSLPGTAEELQERLYLLQPPGGENHGLETPAIGAVTRNLLAQKRRCEAERAEGMQARLKNALRSALTGFVLGWWVPSWYRRNRALERLVEKGFDPSLPANAKAAPNPATG